MEGAELEPKKSAKNEKTQTVNLGDDGESDGSLGVLEQSDGLLMRFAVEQRRVDGVDLVARPQIGLGSRSALKDGLDEDGKVTLRVAQSADDAESQAVGSSLQDDPRESGRSRRRRSSRRRQGSRRRRKSVDGVQLKQRDGQDGHGRQRRWRRRWRSRRRRHQWRIVGRRSGGGSGGGGNVQH